MNRNRSIFFGVKRIKRGFLVFPKTINGKRKWWCKAAWVQEYRTTGWVSIRWAEFSKEYGVEPE